MKTEMEYFENDGFGWRCVGCSRKNSNQTAVSRLMTEGEAESKLPLMSETARAKWIDSDRTSLLCPRCGITEAIVN